MMLEDDPATDQATEEDIVLNHEARAAHALRNILTVASFYEPGDDPEETMAAIRAMARRALFGRSV
jgi:hypothetical protein